MKGTATALNSFFRKKQASAPYALTQ